MIIKKGKSIIISKSVNYQDKLTVGHCSVIGYGEENGTVSIGENLIVGAYSMVEKNVLIGNNCEIGNYCTIYSDTKVGNDVKILSGSRVYWDATVGDRCIINGYVSSNVILEPDVRFFGRIAHSHRNHNLDWETNVEESPIFKKGCFIGLGSLIIGAVTIGEYAYVAAGEIVRCSVPPDTVFYKNKIYDKSFFRGLIQ